MKNNIITLLSVASIGLLAACNGSGTTKSVDSSSDHYHVAPDTNRKVDTSKTTTITGDASTLDNSGSGGTKTAKDSSKNADKH